MGAFKTWLKNNWIYIVFGIALMGSLGGCLSFGIKFFEAESLNRKLSELNRSANIDLVKLNTDNKQLTDDNQRSAKLIEQLKQNIEITSRNNLELTKQANAIRANLNEAIQIITRSK
jgi:hypothetical protein